MHSGASFSTCLPLLKHFSNCFYTILYNKRMRIIMRVLYHRVFHALSSFFFSFVFLYSLFLNLSLLWNKLWVEHRTDSSEIVLFRERETKNVSVMHIILMLKKKKRIRSYMCDIIYKKQNDDKNIENGFDIFVTISRCCLFHR